MSRQPRRLILTLALLILGAVFGHAAEHEGWFSGVFHDHCGETSGHSHEDCPSHDHDRAGCECHGPAAGILPTPVAPSILPAGSIDPASLGDRVISVLPLLPVASLPPPGPSVDRPPRLASVGRAPLLI